MFPRPKISQDGDLGEVVLRLAKEKKYTSAETEIAQKFGADVVSAIRSLRAQRGDNYKSFEAFRDAVELELHARSIDLSGKDKDALADVLFDGAAEMGFEWELPN